MDDAIHDDGLALFGGAGWDIEAATPIKDPTALTDALRAVDALLVRSPTAVADKIPRSALIGSEIEGINFSLGAKGDGEAMAAITLDRAVPEARLVALRGVAGVLSLESL